MQVAWLGDACALDHRLDDAWQRAQEALAIAVSTRSAATRRGLTACWAISPNPEAISPIYRRPKTTIAGAPLASDVGLRPWWLIANSRSGLWIDAPVAARRLATRSRVLRRRTVRW